MRIWSIWFMRLLPPSTAPIKRFGGAVQKGMNGRRSLQHASDMDTLMEFSIQGDIFFFYDTLSDEEKETVRKCMREKYKGHIVANPKIDEFLEGLERDHGIKLKRLSVTSVIAV